MNRFMGIMPMEEVKIIRNYLDGNGFEITIESGNNGYTIIFADGSTMYEDIDDNPVNNFNKALNIAKEKLGKLQLIKNIKEEV